ncbi:MAG: FkbM family methyltransferase [Vicingaceae bacterium]|jgi:FkbM family methyltransferase
MQKLKHFILSIIGNLLRRVYRNKIKYGDHKICTNSDLVSNTTVALIYFNKYEKDEIKLCSKYINPKSDVVELGTSIGVVASHLQQNNNIKKMICVEANPYLHELLRQTFSINSFKETTLLEVAISNNNKPVYFSTRNSNELGKIVEHSEIKINAKSLQQIITENHVTNYSLVCDIEGAECSFIFDEELTGCQLAIIELHPSKWEEKHYSIKELSNLIQDKGFELLEQVNYTSVFKRIANKT